MGDHGRLGPIEWATEARALPGERVCGDRPIVVGVDDTGALVGVLDGLGHGEDAAKAALCGVNVLPGIVGYKMPEVLKPQEVSIRPGDLLIIASDGIAENHLNGIDFAAPSLVNAQEIVGRHSKGTDDALVLVARHRGISG